MTGITRKLCQTDQKYNLIFLISGAFHTKSVSNGPRRSWLCDFRRPAWHEICVSVKLTKITIWSFWFQVHFTRNLCQMARKGQDLCNFRWPASHEICVSVKLTKITINFDFLISGALHTKSVSNGARILCQCQTDQNYKLIFLISGSLHTKSVSNGAGTSWLNLYRFSDERHHTNLCVSVELTKVYNLIFLISGALSYKICVKWPKDIMIYLVSDDRHHTKFVSNWPKLQFDFFDFKCTSHEIICQMALRDHDFIEWFQMTGITRNMCQCQTGQNYN